MSSPSKGVRSENTGVMPVLLAALLILAAQSAFAASDEIRAILDRLDAKEVDAEKSAAPAPALSPSVPTSSASVPKPATPVQPASSSARAARIDPKAKVYGTKDKLPRKIAGQPLAGEFFVLGEYIDGGTVLYAVEDDGKGFLRQYVVVNRTSGLAPGNYFDQGRRPRVTFSREQPLVFVKKLFPGLYAVQVP